MNRFLLDLFILETGNLPTLLRGWREDTINFLRRDMPKILFVLLVSIVLIRLLRGVTNKITALQTSRLPSGLRAQQIRTLASVITSIGVVIILFVAALEVLQLMGFRPEPLLASAGVAGLAIGFGCTDSGARLHQWLFHPARRSVRYWRHCPRR
jgi:small conductance mechanosensitive channel